MWSHSGWEELGELPAACSQGQSQGLCTSDPETCPWARREEVGRVQSTEASQPAGAWPAACWNSETLQRCFGPTDLPCARLNSVSIFFTPGRLEMANVLRSGVFELMIFIG